MKNKQQIIGFLLFLLCGFWQPCYAQENATSHTVLVSVAPHKYFVEQIAGDTITVNLMVPAGASSHTFEPTPKQMLSASKADIWFQIGETFESRAGPALKNFKPTMQFIDLRQGLDLIYCQEGDRGYCSCCHGSHAHSADPHFWLSARQAKKQATTIANALSKRYPEHQQLYEQNLRQFHSKLDALDHEISDIFEPLGRRPVMVSHPAYAYFCRDYNLEQLSIEFEGKDPTPHQLNKILQESRDNDIKTIFIQIQYNNKGARLIADTIGASIVTLDPYSEEYMTTMREIALQFAKTMPKRSDGQSNTAL
jgi:zinc transport system substrate-binding protein